MLDDAESHVIIHIDIDASAIPRKISVYVGFYRKIFLNYLDRDKSLKTIKISSQSPTMLFRNKRIFRR